MSNLVFGNLELVRKPLLSILIPTYKRSDYLNIAIESAINQKNVSCEYEIIVVSNNPEEDFSELIKRYNTIANLYIYVNEENIGMVSNSNRCVELARGKYVAFLHDDDYLLEDYISIVEKYFFVEGQAASCFITGRWLYFEKKDRGYYNLQIKNKLRRIYFIPDLYRKKVRYMKIKYSLYANKNCYGAPSCGTVILKKAFEEIGGFDSQIKYSWDLDFFLRFNLKYKILVCYEPCAVYRYGQNSSLKSEVKFDFYNYAKGKYIDFMKENKISPFYLRLFEMEISNSLYRHWKDALDLELAKRGINRPILKNRLKLCLFEWLSLIYYYTNNMDFQKLLLNDKIKK